jgi:GT2 family glycosyltransferase
MLIGAEVFLGIRKSPNSISKVDWVSGGCMMVKKSLFEKLSGFDENFFMYIEDMEFCYRAKKIGYATYFYSDAKVLHKELGSGNRSFAIINIYKGISHFYAKHKNYFQYIVAKTLLKVKAKTAIIVGILTGNVTLIKTYTSALKF